MILLKTKISLQQTWISFFPLIALYVVILCSSEHKSCNYFEYDC